MADFQSLNEKRTHAYRKDTVSEAFLDRLNRTLAPLEAELLDEGAADSPAALVFIVGLPRSGTTLAAQVVAESMRIGRITNLTARFFETPLVGMTLSRQILGEGSATPLKSDFATTTGAEGLHEFGYFWRSRLGIRTPDDALRATCPLDAAGWSSLKRTLERMAAVAGGSLVMKNLWGGYWAPEFVANDVPCVFVHIDRDPREVYLSILDARRRFFGETRNAWWSMPCPGHQEVMTRPIEEQVAFQVKALEETYDAALSALPTGRLVRWRYDALCRDPLESVSELRAAVAAATGVNIPLKVDELDGIAPGCRPAEDYSAAEAALATVGYLPRW